MPSMAMALADHNFAPFSCVEGGILVARACNALGDNPAIRGTTNEIFSP